MDAQTRFALLLFLHQLALHSNVGLTCSQAVNNVTSEDRLIWTILASYNMHARPTVEAVDISLAFYIESIDRFNDRDQVLQVAAYLEATWQDERLSWNPKDWKNIEYVNLPANMIWKPDFALANAVGDIYNQAFYSSYYLIEVSHNGSISWTPYGQMAIRCVPNLTFYPFDTQKCAFRYENWVYRSSLCKLHPRDSTINLEQFIGSGEWNVAETSAEGVEYYYEGYGNYSDIYFNITIVRKTWFYRLHVIFPCALMSLLVCFVFILPAESDEKVALNMTLLLSFVVFLINVASDLPITSDYTPLLSGYITLVMSTSALSLLCTIFVIRVSHQGRKLVPPLVQRVLVEKIGRGLCVVPSNSSYSTEVELLALKPSARDTVPIAREAKEVPKVMEPFIRDLLYLLKEIERSHAQKRQRLANKHAWNTVSVVIDRILFILFSVVTIVATVVILAIIPYTQ